MPRHPPRLMVVLETNLLETGKLEGGKLEGLKLFLL